MLNQFRTLDVYSIKSCLISCFHQLFMRVFKRMLGQPFVFCIHMVCFENCYLLLSVYQLVLSCVLFIQCSNLLPLPPNPPTPPPPLPPTFTLFCPCLKECWHNFCYFAVKCKLTSEATVIFILPKRIKTGSLCCVVFAIRRVGGGGGGGTLKNCKCV